MRERERENYMCVFGDGSWGGEDMADVTEVNVRGLTILLELDKKV